MNRGNHLVNRRFLRWARRAVCTILIGSMVVGQPAPAWATSKAEKDKKEAQQKLDSANQKANAAEASKSAAQGQVKQLNTELTNLLSDIQLLETDLVNKQAEIDQAGIDLIAAQKTEEKQYASMKKRIQYMYEKGDTEYLDILLQVSDMSDLLNKAEYVESIYTYDRNMLDNYQETKGQIQDLKDQLVEDKGEMEVMELELNEQKGQLETTITKKKKEVTNFDAQLAQAKTDAAAYAKTIELKNEEIKKTKAEEARKKAEAEAKRKAEEAARKKPSSTTKNTKSNDKYSGPSASKSSGGTAQGRAVADYGLKFVGNPYVYGGTSLTNGADCSGFVQSVYRNFGVSVPRSSSEQRSAGREVSYSEAQPGDIVCYAGHVGIYIGDGQIVHASSPSTGIKVGNATYRSILSVRRIL